MLTDAKTLLIFLSFFKVFLLPVWLLLALTLPMRSTL
jgi:hypothetical protein